MLNGEETIIGGLFTQNEIVTRTGIPFLMDLPWWVFGIRYLTGSDKTQILKREIIILIEVEVIPPLKERIAQKKENLIKQAIIENRGYLDNVDNQKEEGHKKADQNKAELYPDEEE